MGFLTNSDGIITQGMGIGNRIVTQGYGESYFIDSGVGQPKEIRKSYEFDIFAPLLKTDTIKKSFFIPVNQGSRFIRDFIQPINKNNHLNISINQPVHNKSVELLKKLKYI